MHNLLNTLISKLKGETFQLDKKIPISYLFRFFLAKAGCLLYGMLVFKTLKTIYVHPSSKIKCRSKITFGKNLNIDRNCFIDALSSEGLNIGDNVSIGKLTTIECTGNLRTLGKGIRIGNNVGLGTRGHFGCAGGIQIGDDTIIGNYVSIHSENHNYDNLNTPIRLQGVNHKGIVIGRNCWIGAKVTILDGTILGDGCIVAAGAVVRGNIPENSIIGGIPAKILKNRAEFTN